MLRHALRRKLLAEKSYCLLLREQHKVFRFGNSVGFAPILLEAQARLQPA